MTTKRYCAYAGLAGLVALATSAVSISAQGTRSTAARIQFDSGRAALKSHNPPQAVAAFRHAITIDPSYYEAHDSLIEATYRMYEEAGTDQDHADASAALRRQRADSLATAELTREYTKWATKHPKVAAYQWALGRLHGRGESAESEEYYRKAVALDPKLARAYAALSYIAELRGDNAASAEYIRKALEADRTDSSYAVLYADKTAQQYRETDFERYRRARLDAARQFAGTERGARSLGWLAYDTPSDSERMTLYERLRSEYVPSGSAEARAAMTQLFDLYMRLSPEKALALAQQMVPLAVEANDQRTWAPRLVFAQNVLLARSLVAQARYAAALAVLDVTRQPMFSRLDEMLVLLRAAVADSASHTKAAYDSLLARFVNHPSDSVYAALVRCGAKRGKMAPQIDSEVWAIRDQAAKPAAAFTLGLYTSNDSVRLADYKGKVVLLTFWFPGCGPCRGEFPHLEHVVQEFQGQGLVYLGVSVVPDEDAFVLPFTRNTHYTFTPLHGTPAVRQAYQVLGEPTNFLIDGQGRIVFSDFLTYDRADESTLHLMIASLLARLRQ